jgi:hypothetical protein
MVAIRWVIQRLAHPISAMLVGTSLISASAALAQDADETKFPGPSHYLRGAYQFGKVLQTNGFLKGDNQSGEPIDSFQSVRLEFGWQTDGSKDWHHVYNFPTFGIGLYGADFNNDEELGTPTSLYGFFGWPMARSGRWRFDFELAFGFTNDWKPYDPVTNPKNVAMGLGRSVHIEVGANAQFRLARRWSLVGGITGTHFSNGGTQRPNHGINQIGPILFAKYDTDDPVEPPARRSGIAYEKKWDLTYTVSAGKRNIDLPFDDPELREQYGNESYFIGNVTAGAAYRFSYKSRVAMGLDFCYDETVGDLMRIDAFNKGTTVDPSTTDNMELGAFGGYEIFAHRTHLILHFGYKLFTKDVEGRLPKFYQRLGVRQFVYRNLFAGLNVRFHEIGSADNLEWVLGIRTGV